MKTNTKSPKSFFSAIVFIMSHDWINLLPDALKQDIAAVVQQSPQSLEVFTKLHQFLTSQNGEIAKKRKIVDQDATGGAEKLEDIVIKLDKPIQDSEIIYSFPQTSFQSPFRKKLTLTFHLLFNPDKTPIPALSIVNPTTNVPELTLVNLKKAIKLGLILPILGNTTVKTKKNIASLCIWLHDDIVKYGLKNEPIICHLNFDIITKQLIQQGKAPKVLPKEDESDTDADDGGAPANDAIVDFIVRQFKLCQVDLVNYLPSTNPARNRYNINTDHGIAISSNNNPNNDLVLVEAYKGSKDGSLVFLSPNKINQSYVIFGFRKPIMLFERRKIRSISYLNITSLTFSVLITVDNPDKPDGEELIEFGMIDHAYYQLIQEFILHQNISDNSFDDRYREKTKDDGKNDGDQNEPSNSDVDAIFTGGVEGEDSEEEDGDFTDKSSDDSGSGSGSDSDSDSDSDDSGIGSGSESGSEEEEEEE